jgi:DNA invertase Pin-like site-specific DNA recombinase
VSGKAIGYIRVSTEEQAREGLSLAAQAEKIRSYAALMGLELVKVIDEAGVSGSVRLADRPGGALIANLGRSKAIRHVIAVRLDRLFRDCADCLLQTRAWDKAGVALHVLDLGGGTLNTASALGRFFISTIAAAAELERGLVSERTAAVMNHLREKRRAYGPVPLGYRRDGDNLVGDQAELEIVRRILKERARGLTFAEIAATLNRERVPTKKGNGACWHPSSVRKVARNPLHRGH